VRVVELEGPEEAPQLVFDPDHEDDAEFEELSPAEHDPRWSKYTLEKMEEIVDRYFNRHWDFEKSIKHNYGVHNVNEIHR
jgi:hypothetical protein